MSYEEEDTLALSPSLALCRSLLITACPPPTPLPPPWILTPCIIGSLVVTLRQRYLLVRGLSVSKDLLRAKGLSAPVEAATLQEQILLAEGKGGLEIGGVILKAAKDAAAELSAVLPMASVGTEEDAFVPLMSLMEAVALSQKAVEEETGKREGAILLQALVVQVFACVCLCVCVYTHTHTHTHTHIHTYIHTYI